MKFATSFSVSPSPCEGLRLCTIYLYHRLTGNPLDIAFDRSAYWCVGIKNHCVEATARRCSKGINRQYQKTELFPVLRRQADESCTSFFLLKYCRRNPPQPDQAEPDQAVNQVLPSIPAIRLDYASILWNVAVEGTTFSSHRLTESPVDVIVPTPSPLWKLWRGNIGWSENPSKRSAKSIIEVRRWIRRDKSYPAFEVNIIFQRRVHHPAVM